MQALHQWSFPTLGFMKSSGYDKFACTQQHPAIMPPPPHSTPNPKRTVDDRDSLDFSPAKRLRLSAAEGHAFRDQHQSAPPKPTLPQQPVAQSTQPANDKARCQPDMPLPAAAAHQPSDRDRKDQSPGSPRKMNSSKLDLARAKIEAQLNLEILLKHDELRLIEQEMAKAQICLEQIRRCRILPYPGQPSSSASVDNLSDGTGPALEPPAGLHRPAHASAWGVTDGPYSQHYARWLIPDPDFDAGHSARSRSSIGGKSVDGRGLRSTDRDTFAGRRRQRSSIDVGAPMSPAAAPQRQPGGPLILTRADGVKVKLVCRHCSKEGINSVQGFLNHCRIAHSDSMKTHAEAAATHGVPLEEGEMSAVATPSAGEPVSETPTAATVSHAWPRTNVHPLNVAGRMLQPPSTPTATTPVRPSPLSSSFSASSGYRSTATKSAMQPSPTTLIGACNGTSPSAQARSHTKPAAPAPSPDSNFVGSTQTPSLSALAQKRGIGLNLAKLVTSAKQRVDIDKIETLVPDSEVEENAASGKSQPMARQPSSQSRPVLPAAPALSHQLPGMRVPTQPQFPGRLNMDHVEQNRVIPNSQSSSFDRMLPSSPHQETGPESYSPRSAAHTAGTSETNPGLITDHEDEVEDEEYEVADSEDDRNPRHVRIRGENDEDFPMQDVSENSTTATTEDKLGHVEDGSVAAQHQGGLVEKKGRGRPKSKK